MNVGTYCILFHRKFSPFCGNDCIWFWSLDIPPLCWNMKIEFINKVQKVARNKYYNMICWFRCWCWGWWRVIHLKFTKTSSHLFSFVDGSSYHGGREEVKNITKWREQKGISIRISPHFFHIPRTLHSAYFFEKRKI